MENLQTDHLVTPTKNQSKPLVLILTILVIVFASLSIFFFIYLTYLNKTNTELNSSNTINTNNIIPTDIPTKTSSEKPIEIQTKTGPYIENNYFVIPDWGIKYKLSDKLTGYGWIVNINDEEKGFKYGLTAALKSEVNKEKTNSYPGPTASNCAVGIVSRDTKTANSKNFDYDYMAIGPRKTMVMDNYVYSIDNNVGYCPGFTNNNSYLKDLSEIITDILSKPEKL